MGEALVLIGVFGAVVAVVMAWIVNRAYDAGFRDGVRIGRLQRSLEDSRKRLEDFRKKSAELIERAKR